MRVHSHVTSNQSKVGGSNGCQTWQTWHLLRLTSSLTTINYVGGVLSPCFWLVWICHRFSLNANPHRKMSPCMLHHRFFHPIDNPIRVPSDLRPMGERDPPWVPYYHRFLRPLVYTLGWGMYDHQSFQNNEGIGLEWVNLKEIKVEAVDTYASTNPRGLGLPQEQPHA